MRSRLAFSIAALLLACAGAARAGQVRGTIVWPAEVKRERRFPGYWRVDNGVVPIQGGPSRSDGVVVLAGAKGAPPAARTVTAEIQGLQVVPPVFVLGEGSVVEIRNGDRVAHDLSIPEDVAVMPLQRLAPGAMRRVRFPRAGGYHVRSAEHPQAALSVIVVTTPHHGTIDDRGAFKIADVPDGRATLKIWRRGRWVHTQEIEVGAKSADLALIVGSGRGGREAATE